MLQNEHYEKAKKVLLGLRLATDEKWAKLCENNINSILNDHAWCEQKAASNAISVITKFPMHTDLVESLTKIAIEELEHFNLVLEKMKSARVNKSIEKQILLLPEVINLQPIPLALIIENIDLLSEIGFVIEPFGAGMVIVREIPALIGHADIKQIIIDLGDDLSSAGLPSSYLAKVDLILGNIACHRSVRSGRVLNETEMNNLLREMEITPNSGQCNHGRPTSISLSLKDIEKLFNRT